jgi:adenine phosphoribosyltransferase
MQRIESLIRDVPDFPKKGIVFKDITPMLADPEALGLAIASLSELYLDSGISHVAGIESRGFIFGVGVAQKLGVGFVPIRKPGKLPCDTHRVSYALEYGEDSLEIHRDALSAQSKVVIIDDLLATGGTAKAAIELVERCEATVHAVAVVIELEFLAGRKKLGLQRVDALLRY